jgi:hypothetical protein
LWVRFPPGTFDFATVKIEASLLFFLFYGACEQRKNIKMSNWSTEKTKQAPRTKSIQANLSKHPMVQNILSSNAFSILFDILAEEIQISFLEELHRIDVLVFSCSQEQ